ncbi:MAG: TolC family protein [Cyclobacteriaceae bacterium]|nr:TolC family protein [Cyclobacteriaceae bacterium]
MIKRIYLTLVVGAGLAAAQPAVAQDQPVSSGQTFTLQQCIDYALENSITARNAKLDEEIAQAKVKETVGVGLPQVNGTVSLTHNERLPRFFSTRQTAFGFSGLADSLYNQFYPELENDDVLASQNFFQLKSSGDAGVNVTQIIFNGSYLVGLQASQAYKELSYRSSAQTKEQIIQQVTKAYYAVLINKERSDLFTSNIARVDTLLRNTQALFKNGFAESIDADRIQVTLNNLVAERDKFLNLNELGIALLKFQMNYPLNQPIQVEGKIEDVQSEVSTALYQETIDYNLRPDFQVLEANRKLQELNLKNQRAAYLPSLSAFANLGYSTQSATIGGLFKTNSDISDNGSIGPDKWYPYTMFGLTLNVPIFSGFQTRYKVQQEKIALQKIQNTFVSVKSGIDLEVQQSTINYKNAMKSLNAQKQNMELASKVARITKIKYEQGVGSNLEVIDAEDSLRQAQTNYYNALYDVMVAKIDLDKAYGKLAPQSVSK